MTSTVDSFPLEVALWNDRAVGQGVSGDGDGMSVFFKNSDLNNQSISWTFLENVESDTGSLFGSISMVGNYTVSGGSGGQPITTLKYNGTHWNVVSALYAPPNNPVPLNFGQELTLSITDGKLLAVSSNTISDGGVVFVFSLLPNDTWTEVANLTDTGGSLTDQFGRALALSNDTLVVGSPTSNVSAVANAGAISVFTRSSGGTWSFLQRIGNPHPNTGDGFGIALSFSMGYLAVGNKDSDTVYIYKQNTTDLSFSLSQTLNFTSGSGFGVSVAQDDQYLYISAQRYNNGTGLVRVYVLDSGQYALNQTINETVQAELSFFGYRLGAGGGSACVIVADQVSYVEFWCPQIPDDCGVCGGNGSSCANTTTTTTGGTTGDNTTTTTTTGSTTGDVTTGAEPTTGSSTTGEPEPRKDLIAVSWVVIAMAIVLGLTFMLSIVLFPSVTAVIPMGQLPLAQPTELATNSSGNRRRITHNRE